MSYILDALKKSDEERQDQSRSLPLRDLAPLASRRRKSNTPIAVLLTLLIAAAIGGGCFWFFNSYSVVPLQTEINQPQSQGFPSATSTAAPEEEIKTAPPAPVVEHEILQPAPIYDYSTAGKVITSAEQLESLAPKYPELIHMEELPNDLLQTLPKLEFAGHAYSQSPQDRLIIINNKIVREGSLITDHLILKEITPEGVVMSYKTIDFQVLTGP